MRSLADWYGYDGLVNRMENSFFIRFFFIGRYAGKEYLKHHNIFI